MKARIPNGMGGGPSNLNAMIKQAQKMQEDMAQKQAELDEREYDISAGGGVVGVKINGIVKGLSGSPGEVKGYFNSGKTGTLLGNTDCGVYGVLAELPKDIHGEPMALGLRDSVKEGKAYVYTMLDSNKVEKYEVMIGDIQRDATGNKCFTVKVTDKALISKTGGIIQGMSGSPIVQNGKLIGAVTHVLINDPTTGYGIFIENMLDQMGDLAS